MSADKKDDDFGFPFQPYDIQLGFMKSLYDVLQEGGVGIFESPTGTGKSLSIICGSLKWLKDFQEEKKRTLQELMKEDETSSTDDWFANFSQKQERSNERLTAKEELDIIETREAKISSLRKPGGSKQVNVDRECLSSKKVKLETAMFTPDEEDDLLLEDVETTSLDKVDETIKIYYASRTHSQLLQFMNEFRKTPYNDTVTVTSLASRATLCVNKHVNKLKSHRLVNERCSELLGNRGTSKKKVGCGFYNKSKMKLLQDNILSETLDIEDLVSHGKDMSACPYYSVRNTIPDVELVLLPYNVLMHRSTRLSSGITLKDNIVIIDEAHNLIDAINDMHSIEISGLLLKESESQLRRYFDKYKKRFAARTVRYIYILLHILDNCLKFLTKTAGVAEVDDDVDVTLIKSFLSDAKMGNINFFEVAQFCEESHIGNKLHGFATKGCPESTKSPTSELLAQFKNPEKKGLECKRVVIAKEKSSQSVCPSAFNSFIEFMKALTIPPECGRIVYCRKSSIEMSFVKILNLSPGIHFADIVTEARATVLAGGTMAPISNFVNQLLIPAGVQKDKIVHHSFGHVMPSKNVQVMAISSGFQGTEFDFRFGARFNESVLNEFGNALLKLAVDVPGGIICFFASYSYEEYVYSFLMTEGLLSQIEKHKVVFREPKESKLVEELLSSYARAIIDPEGNKGAILFSVVGGKMSEGINFADYLCRCVVMVGLPFAKRDNVLVEKLTYLTQTFGSTDVENYTIMCMKAVNQSIGRAIRHKNDYAVILLVDLRYSNEVLLSYLPAWLPKVSKPASFLHAILDIKAFFSQIEAPTKDAVFVTK